MTTFAAHGIQHLSPSSLNLWASAPALWVMKYLYRIKDAPGPAMARGTAAETGIAHALTTGAPPSECVQKAEAQFDELTCTLFPVADSRRDKERASIAGMVEQGIEALKGYGPPVAMQRKIVHEVEGLPPILGYLDFEWDGIVVDCKTQMALAGSIRLSHARQLSFYVHNTNAQARVMYITPKKSAVYAVENASDHFKSLVRIGQSIRQFLAVSPERAALAAMLSPDVESFYYSDPAVRQAAFEIFGV